MATAELTGTQLSEPAALLLVGDLMEYPEEAVMQALNRCRRELKSRLTLAEIVSHIEDGRPGPDEAWAMLPWDETQTAVLTQEMMEAMGIARHAWNAGDRTGARFAFRESYIALVAAARSEKRAVEWQVSLGFDRAGREGPLREAVDRGRLTAADAQRFLPEWGADVKALPPPPFVKELANKLGAMPKKGRERDAEG